MGTQFSELSLPRLIEEGRRVRQEFDANVVKLRRTLERTKTVAAAWGWLEPSALAGALPEAAPETGVLGRLTRREIEVLRLIADGKSSKEIASELGIAFRTAVCHRYRIFQKLKVHETASMVRVAVRAGLIEA